MSDSTDPMQNGPTLHPEFVKNIVRTFEGSDDHGYHAFLTSNGFEKRVSLEN